MSINKLSICDYPFRNPDIPLEDRVKDLISHLTLEEKISLIPTKQAAIERLGINEYTVGGEAAHGWVSRDGDKATVFPQTIGLACTWNVDLMKRIGSVIGDEARAYHKLKNTGLTLWAPTVDMERDPRWGRTEEAYGEDPWLTGEMASALVRGMQGSDPYYLKMAATLKHFYANNNEKDRGFCSVSIEARNKYDYYWKPFKKIIKKAGVCCLMTAYNEVNGTPCILNKDVKEVVKGKWGLSGFVVADGQDFSQTVTLHEYYDDHVKSIADTLKSGIDCIPDDPVLIKKSLHSAIERKLLKEEDIDQAIRNIFRVRFRFGEFDPEVLNPYSSLDSSVICCEENKQLALEAARESIVLLKNRENILPLNEKDLNKIAVIGPLAEEVYPDWYTGVFPYKVTPLDGIKNKIGDKEIRFVKGTDKVAFKSLATQKYISPNKDGILLANKKNLKEEELYDLTDWGWGSFTLKSKANNKYLRAGEYITASAEEVYGWFVRETFNLLPQDDGTYIFKTWDDRLININDDKLEVVTDNQLDIDEYNKFTKYIVENGREQAVRAAAESDLAVVFLGNHPLINGKEEIDREDIVLPPEQEKLIKAVYKANPNTIVVLISSYPVAINYIDENIPGIIYSSHGGQELGNALADVLFGDYNPAARLNMTWYRSIDQLPDIMDYDIIKGKRTYMYFDGKPLYPFGYGLSYTQFTYSNLQLNRKELSVNQSLEINLTIENTGLYPGDEVVQLYLKCEELRVIRPEKELKGFKRIYLEPGESKDISFKLSVAELEYWNKSKSRYILESGKYRIMIGSSSQDIRLEKCFMAAGEKISDRKAGKITLAENFDDYNGITLAEIKENRKNCVKFRKTEDWIAFYNIDFFNDIFCFQAQAFSEGSGESFLEIRLDSPEGRLLGVCVFKGEKLIKTKTDINKVKGKHDLYLKARGKLGLYRFRFIGRE